ncbi:MAG: Smr/MutS family protein [Legionella sp.]|nr:Smr/MutS family protein [Legionella sp.]
MSDDWLSEEDKALFRKVTDSVKPLKKSKIIAPRAKPRAALSHKPARVTKIPVNTQPLIHLSNFYTNEVDAQSVLSFCRHSIPGKRLRELKQGRIPWESRLDLHGLRQDDAELSLVRFIMEKIALHQRCLLIIHGKGSPHGEAPVLKNLVNHWLRQIPQVLAFHSALPKEGGAGALYVLLKRNRETENW